MNQKHPPEPPKNCELCPRLVGFRQENIQAYPAFHNGAVQSLGPKSARLLILGLAPGLKGANQTGRPFTGDASGILLFKCLLKTGLASGKFENHAQDSLSLQDTMITNAVCCVPPQNKPTADEIKKCRPFLQTRIQTMPNLKVVLALGHLAHNATLQALEYTQSHYKFGHNTAHRLPAGFTLLNSYHCSRYNVNTGVLTEDMFVNVLENAKKLL